MGEAVDLVTSLCGALHGVEGTGVVRAAGGTEGTGAIGGTEGTGSGRAEATHRVVGESLIIHVYDTHVCHVTPLLKRLEVPCGIFSSFQPGQSLGSDLNPIQETEVG